MYWLWERKESGYRIIQSMLLLLLSGAVVVCGRNGQQIPEETVKEQMVIWCYYETDAQRQAMDDLTAGFNAVSEQYAIRWEYVPMTDFSKRLSMGYTENSLPDLVLMDNPDRSEERRVGKECM